MKKLISITGTALLIILILIASSCSKEPMMDDCHHGNGNGNGNGNTGNTQCLLEPYKSAIIFTYSPQAAFKNDGTGYAKTEPSGNVAIGPAATYKVTQVWVWTGSGFVSDEAGVDNHGGSSASLNHQIDAVINSVSLAELKLGANGMPTNINQSYQYLVVTLESHPNSDGTYLMAGSTNSFDEAPGVSPERLRLDEATGFLYDITSYKIMDANDVFVW